MRAPERRVNRRGVVVDAHDPVVELRNGLGWEVGSYGYGPLEDVAGGTDPVCVGQLAVQVFDHFLLAEGIDLSLEHPGESVLLSDALDLWLNPADGKDGDDPQCVTDVDFDIDFIGLHEV